MLLKFSKGLLTVFILYYLWFKESFGNFPALLYGTVVLATLFIVVDILYKKKIPHSYYVFMLFLFGGYAFISGLFVANDTKWFFSILTTYFAYSVVCFDCFYIFYRTGERDWILNAILISSVLAVVQCVFFGAQYQTEALVTTMSENNNPNSLGLTMILGIFSLVAKERYTKKHFPIIVMLIMSFLYVIILSGSRKSLICGGALTLIWIIPLLKTEKGFTFRKILIVSGLFVAVIGGVIYAVTQFANTSIYSRFLLIESGRLTRSNLYNEALEFWKESPIIGIGFGQFQTRSVYRIYSHSTYAEILSCNGIIGCLVFFIPFFNVLYSLVNKAIGKNTNYRYDYAMCLAMLVVELALGVGQIFIYDFSHLIILLYLFTSCDFIDRENDLQQQQNTYYRSRFSFLFKNNSDL